MKKLKDFANVEMKINVVELMALKGGVIVFTT
jgi:hypothetical protein